MSARAAAMLGLAVIWPSLGSAQTIGVIATTDDADELPLATVQSVAWHALREELGHRALVLDGTPDEVLPTLLEHHITSLAVLEVHWDHRFVRLDDGSMVVPPAPEVKVSEYRVDGDAIRLFATWEAIGAAALYRVSGEDDGLLTLPEVSLQETMAVAVRALHAPAWGDVPDPVRLPVLFVADEEYRSFYGRDWKEVVQRRIDRANALLEQAGLELVPVGMGAWRSPDAIDGLSGLLDALAAEPIPPEAALRVAFTQQHRLASENTRVEDVGRAYVPGRDVILADQAAPPGHQEGWDTAEEGVAMAHEVLHALGVPHLRQPHFLMSASKSGVVHVIADSTRELGRAAVQARLAHWDRQTALGLLGQVADSYLEDPDLQVDYIIENLAAGPGMPAPGEIAPTRLSALTNVAVGRYYLRRARKEPEQALALREVALMHSQTALAQHPRLPVAEALVTELTRERLDTRAAPPRPAPPRPTPPEPDPGVECDVWVATPWDPDPTCER